LETLGRVVAASYVASERIKTGGRIVVRRVAEHRIKTSRRVVIAGTSASDARAMASAVKTKPSGQSAQLIEFLIEASRGLIQI
jgi:hypothetical protein